MNINSIQAPVGLQNAARPENKNSTAIESRAGSPSVQINAGVISPGNGTAHVQKQGVTEANNMAEKKLDALMINYPPFFPIGKYQRIDLIKKIKGVQEEVEKSSLHNDLKKTLIHTRLQDNASDKDIASAMDNLFELRNKLARKESAPADTSKTGTILNIKV